MISFFLRLIWFFLSFIYSYYYLWEIAGCIQLVKQFRSLPERLLYLPLLQSPSLHTACTKLVFLFKFPASKSTCLVSTWQIKKWKHNGTLSLYRAIETNTLERNGQSCSVGTQVLLFLLPSCKAHTFVDDLCFMKSPYWWVLLLFSVESILSPQDMLQDCSILKAFLVGKVCS